MLVYQIGAWVQTGLFATGQMSACAVGLVVLYMLLRRNPRKAQ